MFQRPEQVVTLLHQLATIVQDATAKGEKAPTYDLCKVSVKGTNLFCADNVDIPRDKMPQLKGKPKSGSPADSLPKDSKGEVDLGPAFRHYMEAQGHKVDSTTEYASRLRASQREMSGNKVAGMVKSLENGLMPPAAIFVSKENYVVDGHHRWAANVGYGLGKKEDIQMPVLRIDLPVLETLKAANEFAISMGIPQAGVSKLSPIDCLIAQAAVLYVVKFNPYHDPHTGQFASRGAYGWSGITQEEQALIEKHLQIEGVTMEAMGARGKELMEQAKHAYFLAVYKQEGTFEDDGNWYVRANGIAGAMSKRYGYSEEQAAGALAACSPRVTWDDVNASGKVVMPNVKAACVAMRLLKEDMPITFTPEIIAGYKKYDKQGKWDAEAQWSEVVGKTLKPSEMNARQLGFVMAPFVLSFPENNTKAVRILRGEKPSDVLGGTKVRSFYNNILAPEDHSSVTVDTWMVRALTGKDKATPKELYAMLTNPQKGKLRGIGSYPAFQEIITRIADEYGVVPDAAQAIMWVVARRNKEASRGGH